MPDIKPKTRKTKPHQLKEEILESPDETVIASADSQELEAEESSQEQDTRQSIYQELSKLGLNADQNAWTWIGALSLLLVGGILIGGMVGMLENQVKQTAQLKSGRQPVMMQNARYGTVNPVSPVSPVSAVNAPQAPQVVYCIIVARPLGSETADGTSIGQSPLRGTSQQGQTGLAQTGGLQESAPTATPPMDDVPTAQTTGTAATGTSRSGRSSSNGQFKVVDNQDGSTSIVW